ncbi:MAG: MFS transporter [Spirochaetia bacterium]|nr:MFS transporter [Spirochaetia bacterium]
MNSGEKQVIPFRIPILTLSLIFFSMLPVTMIVPVFKDIVKDKLGGDNLMVSYFMSVAMLGSFLFSPVAGFMSDKLGNRKWFITLFAFLDGIIFFLLPLSRELGVLHVLRFLEGSFHIFVISLLLSLVADRENDPNSKYHKKGLLLGIAGMVLSLGVGLGSPLGILGRKNPELPFLFAGILMIGIGIVSLFFLKDYEYHYTKKINFKDWVNAFRENRLLGIPYLYNFIDRFTVGFFVTSFNLHLREDLGLNSGQVGMYLSFVLLPMSLLALPFALLAKKMGAVLLMMAGSLIYGFFLAISGYITNTNILIISLIFCGVGAGVMFVPSMMMAASLAKREYNASVMAGFTGVGSIGFMLGPIFAVLILRFLEKFYPNISFGTVSLLFGSLEILVVFFTLPLYKKLRAVT